MRKDLQMLRSMIRDTTLNHISDRNIFSLIAILLFFLAVALLDNIELNSAYVKRFGCPFIVKCFDGSKVG